MPSLLLAPNRLYSTVYTKWSYRRAHHTFYGFNGTLKRKWMCHTVAVMGFTLAHSIYVLPVCVWVFVFSTWAKCTKARPLFNNSIQYRLFFSTHLAECLCVVQNVAKCYEQACFSDFALFKLQRTASMWNAKWKLIHDEPSAWISIAPHAAPTHWTQTWSGNSMAV